jgi:type I restriction enzyme S subunit
MNSALEKTLPDEWVETTIEDSCEILDKLRKPISQKNRINGEYPYYGATGIVDYINDFIFDERLVLVGEDGAKWERGDKTGFIAEGKYWVNNHAHVLRVNEDVLIDKWLVYFLCVSNLSDYITGTTVPKLNQQKLKSINLPIAPLEEQKRIVAKIDTLFTKIDKAISLIEESLKQAKNLLPSVLKEIFDQGKADGWEENKLGEVCTIINGRAYKKTELLAEGKYKVLRVGNLFTNNSWYWSDLELKQDKYVSKGDLIYAWSASFGPRLWDGEKVIYHYHIWKIINGKEVSKNFLYNWLDWKTESIKKENTSGATMIHVTKGMMESLVIHYPSVQVQEEVVQSVLKVKKTCVQTQLKLEEQLAYLKQLKSSILSKAFKGEL